MSYIKTKEEIEKIVEGGKILGEILEKLANLSRAGMSAFEIDTMAEKMIRDAGGLPAFKGYRSRKSEPPFPSTICASVNEELVHGIASKDKILKDGDIFSIDIGMQWPAKSDLGQNGNGFFTDTALTVPIGKIPEKTKQLLAVTKKSLEVGITAVKKGGSISDIGKQIQEYVTPYKYGIIRDLVGHGVGHAVHEEPRVPNYFDSDLSGWDVRSGVVIAIEPMISMGSYEIVTASDGWSIATADGSLCAHFEHTIIVDYDGQVIVATRRPSEKK